jgi:hypothetical protein
MVGHGRKVSSKLKISRTSPVPPVTINGAGFMTGLIGGLSGNAEVNIRNLFTEGWPHAA